MLMRLKVLLPLIRTTLSRPFSRYWVDYLSSSYNLACMFIFHVLVVGLDTMVLMHPFERD